MQPDRISRATRPAKTSTSIPYYLDWRFWVETPAAIATILLAFVGLCQVPEVIVKLDRLNETQTNIRMASITDAYNQFLVQADSDARKQLRAGLSSLSAVGMGRSRSVADTVREYCELTANVIEFRWRSTERELQTLAADHDIDPSSIRDHLEDFPGLVGLLEIPGRKDSVVSALLEEGRNACRIRGVSAPY